MLIHRKCTVAVAVCFALISSYAAARNYIFDASQLGGDVSNTDIALFNQGGQLPGTYTVDVLLNGELVDSRDVVFRQGKAATGELYLQPCLSRERLSRYGVKVEDYPRLMGKGGPAQSGMVESCVDLSAIPQAQADFHFSSQQLLLSVPQVALRPTLRGIAPEALWDDGMPALLMNYRLSNTRTEYRGGMNGRNDSQYVQLEPGANLGAWRLRNSTTWQKSSGQSGRWQSSYTYAERGFNALKSRLTLGERFTPSEVFDSVPFRGVMMGSDEAMVPSYMRAFSPIVRGIARTQARVEVKQNGYTLYNATVAPGPFNLHDLSTTSAGGDLQVTVWETDGSPQVFAVPYQTPAIALHEGYLDYNLMGGQYRSSDKSTQMSTVGQLTMMYGLPWNLTLYGGVQGAENYQAISSGLGMSLGSWGSLSLDGTQARGQRKGEESEHGGTWRVRYSKMLESTNTSFALSSYQYASSGYNTLSEVLDSYHKGSTSRSNGGYSSNRDRRKTRSTLMLNQSLGDWGYVNLNGSRENYWNRTGHQDSLSAGYGIGLQGMSLSLNWVQNRNSYDGQQRNDRILSFMASMPLDRWLGGNIRTNYQLISPSSGGETQQVGLGGQAFNRQLNWSVSQRYRSGPVSGDRNNSTVQMGWSGGYGQLNGNHSYSPSAQQTGVDASGGMVFSREGATFGQTLDMNNGVALIAAPGASGVPVSGWPGVQTDFRGYTTLSYLNPYQENTVSLDPSRLPLDAEINQTDVKVVPTKGAVIPAKFITRIGMRALITLAGPDGRAVPFGALATLDSAGAGITGIVGNGGQVYLSGLAETGVLTVKWGQAQAQQCRAEYRLYGEPGPADLYMTGTACR